jgi:heme oxygenase
MKTIADYMNDPRLLNDPEMAKALEPIREIHAARLMLQDETAGMTTAEKVAFINARGKETLIRFGLTPKIGNLSGQGKLKPRVVAGV